MRSQFTSTMARHLYFLPTSAHDARTGGNLMKHILWSTLLFIAPLTSAHAQDGQPPTERVMPITQVYLPSGPSAREPVRVVIEGQLPDSCYTFARAEVRDDSAFVHEIRSIATVRHEGYCLMRVRNYSRYVELGLLQAGVHKLLFAKRDGTYFEVSLQVN